VDDPPVGLNGEFRLASGFACCSVVGRTAAPTTNKPTYRRYLYAGARTAAWWDFGSGRDRAST